MVATLILIPTVGEQQVLTQRMSGLLQRDDIAVELCGFGPVAAAARTMSLIAEHTPERILLIGIAGALTTELSAGTALLIDEVALYGVGAGSGDTFKTAGQMGWAHWTMDADSGAPRPIGDVISLWPTDATPPAKPRQLLTVCAAAATKLDVRDRLNRFPNAIAEDMEGFSVALAAKLADVPLGIVRGISNIAGDRDKSRWKIIDALNAAADAAMDLLQ